MFCKHCGAQLNNNVKFCGSCGAATSATAVDTAVTNAVTKTSSAKKRKHGFVLVVVAILLLGIWALSGGKSAEKTAVTFVENMLEADAKKCVSLLTDDAVEQTGYATRKVLINVMEDALEEMRDEYKDKYGKKWKYDVSVVDSYEQTYEYYDGGYIGEAVEGVVEIQHTGSGLFNDTEGKETETLILVKDGRKWLVSGFGF